MMGSKLPLVLKESMDHMPSEELYILGCPIVVVYILPNMCDDVRAEKLP